jgi:outer membrane protein assembly factor BamE
MPAMPLRQSRLILAVAVGAALAACSSTHSIATAITPYKIEIVQGNFISKEQVQALRPGMTRDQVKQVMGTPLLTDLFHADRWDYVFTLKRQGVPPQKRHLAVFFKGEVMDRVEGDEMPSESEFVATIDAKRAVGKIPKLEASEDELRAFSAKNPPAPATPEPAPAAAAPTSYPPLEAPAR